MGSENFLLHLLFYIFTGAAILATLVLFTRQSLLVAYMMLGVAFGPYGLKIVPNAHIIKETGDVGILFLLFLLGLHLDPRDLFSRLKAVSSVGLISSLAMLF
jgi:Kef-type K+ transport system membrane component KefB